MYCKGIVAIERDDVRMVDVPVYTPDRHDVQIRMVTTLVSTGTERAWVKGLPNAVPQYPYVPGYCGAGYVECVGTEVDGFSIGDRVACYAVDIGHREIGNVPDYRVVHIPDEVSFEHAAFTSLGQTSLQGVRKCDVEIGESVVALGVGIIGILALEFARLNGAMPVIAIDRVEKRLQLAIQCGADAAINNSEPDWINRLRELTQNCGANVVIDNTGVPSAMRDACAIAANYARICILGCPRGTTEFDFYNEVQKKSIRIIGAHAVDSIPRWTSYPNHWTFRDDAECFLRFAAAGRLNLDRMIESIVEKSNAEAAYRDLIRNKHDALSMIIRWS